MDPHGPCAHRATPPGRYLRDRGLHHLPCAKGHSAIADGKGEIGTKKAGLVGEEVLFKEQKISSYRHLGMSRHVVRAFTGVLERNLLWDKPVQKNVAENKVCAVVVGEQQQSGRLGSLLPSVKYNAAAAQRDDTHTGKHPYTA